MTEKMKIGILTQPMHLNYGGILQNWALQQVLKRLGHRPVMINRLYTGEKVGKKVILLRFLSLGKTIVRKYILRQDNAFLMWITDPEFHPYWPKSCDTSMIKKIDHTRPLVNDEKLRKEVGKQKFDAFIVGSDQVWREAYSPRIESYFLDFLEDGDKRPKVSYAASFGVSEGYISDEKMQECSRLLGRFDSVSVREDSGVEVVKRDFGRDDAVKVLDPTLLLEAKDYEQLIKPKDRHHKPYIAAYILDKTDDKRKIVDEVKEKLGLEVTEFSGEFEGKRMLTMSQWLAAIADAEFVVTDSFHGTVFSIIFGKPFIAIANKMRGTDRFTSILGEMGLMDRLVFTAEDFEKRKDKMMDGIDFKGVKDRLDGLRSKSKDWLTKALRPS